MNTIRTTLLVMLSAALFSTGAESASTREAVAARDCAELIRERLGTSHYEVVKMTRGGSRTFTFWMNANDIDHRGYCVVRAGEIVQTEVLAGHWNRTHMYHPQPNQTAGLSQ